MIDDLLGRIFRYDRRVGDAWSRMNGDDYEEDWEENPEDPEENGETDGETFSAGSDYLNLYDTATGEIFFDETAEVVLSHLFRPDRAVRYTVSPDNPWYFDIDGVVFSRETGLLVRFPTEKSGEYTLPDDGRITGIGPYAFRGVTKLEKITLGSRILYIGERAFDGCSGLTEIEVPESVEFLGNDVFAGCTSMKRAVLNCSVGTVPHRCFYWNTSLESVRYPASVTEIVRGAFSGCRSLKDVRPAGETRTDYDVVIAPSVTKIGGEAFCECESVRSVLLPESTKIIWRGAFMNCVSLKTINTESVEEFGSLCFCNCISLESIAFGSNTRKLMGQLLLGTDSLKTVRFSCASDISCAPDALPEDKEYAVDTEAWLSVSKPYACRKPFLSCVRNIAEGEKVSEETAAAAKKTMRRNRSRHYGWFLENEAVLRWVLEENIPAGDAAMKMMKSAEADGRTDTAALLGAWLKEHYSPRLLSAMEKAWEEDEPVRAAERAEEEKREKEELEEQERYREEREKAVQEEKDLPLEDLDLDICSYKSLKREGYNYLSEVAEKTVLELNRISGLRIRGINEIKRKMEQLEKDGQMTFPGQKLIERRPFFDDSLDDFSVDDLSDLKLDDDIMNDLLC